MDELLSRQEYDLENHTVSILELNVADLTEGSKYIGQNKFAEEEEQDEGSECSNDKNSDDEEIIGMSLREKQEDSVRREALSKKETKSLKEMKSEIKKTALKQMKRSNAFQQKQKLEQQKNRKQSRRKLQRAQKLAQKRGKHIKRKGKK